jgi:hypothetical protein
MCSTARGHQGVSGGGSGMLSARSLVVAGLCLMGASGAAGAVLDWRDLAPDVAVEDNPFAPLSDSQIDQLRRLALSRLLVQRLGHRSDEVATHERQIISTLTQQGIDAEALLAQREALMAERRARAEALRPSVDGQALQLVGYLVPIVADSSSVRDFLLVPWAGACSHMPPPAANQLLRVQLPEGEPDPSLMQRAVRVAGTVRMRPQWQQVSMVDGVLTVASGYAVDNASITLTGPPAARPSSDRSP